jgi:hypothetical protein
MKNQILLALDIAINAFVLMIGLTFSTPKFDRREYEYALLKRRWWR